MDEIPIQELDIENYGEEDLEQLFYTCSEKIKTLNSMTNENKLYLYKYYKQATIGNINIKLKIMFIIKFIGLLKMKEDIKFSNII